jgi:hypothetical protein
MQRDLLREKVRFTKARHFAERCRNLTGETFYERGNFVLIVALDEEMV